MALYREPYWLPRRGPGNLAFLLPNKALMDTGSHRYPGFWPLAPLTPGPSRPRSPSQQSRNCNRTPGPLPGGISTGLSGRGPGGLRFHARNQTP